MFTVMVLLIILVSIVLSVVVLSQSSKGDGLSGALGAPGSVGAVFGVRRASDFLQRATMWLGGIFLGLCVVANLFFLPSGNNTPNAVAGGQMPKNEPVTRQAPAQAQPSAPAAPSSPAGAQPGTGQTNPDNSPMK